MMNIAYPLVLFASIGGVAIFLCARAYRDDQRWLTTWLTTALVLRMLAATMFAAIPATRMAHEDADGYEWLGMAMARGWLGMGPVLDPLGEINQNYGYKYISAGIYYVLGQYAPLLSYFNCVIGMLCVFLVYHLARQFFHTIVARRAALLTALVPSMILWSSVAMKDVIMSFLILIGLTSSVAFKRRASFWSMAGIAGSIAAMQPVRYYMVYFLGFAIVVSLFFERGLRMFSGIYKQIVLVLAVVVLLALVGISGNVSDGAATLTLQRLSMFRRGMATTANSGFDASADISTPGGALTLLPLGVAELLLGPFPWQFGSLRALFAVPETIYWWILFPSLLRGLIWSTRQRFAETSPLVLFAVVMTAAYSLMQGNIGSGFRQRSQIFVILFIFASFGLFKKRAERANIDGNLLLVNALKEPPRQPEGAPA
jgi:hypothetical protein